MDDRALHLINLSLPKTGSATLARMFDRHRSVHELWYGRSVDALLDREEGSRTDDDLDDFLLTRDQAARPEVDAATFLHLAGDRLPELFPDARFLIVLRPCVEWAASFLGMLMEVFGPGGWGTALADDWVARYAAHVAPSLPGTDLGSRLAITAARGPVAAELAEYWGRRTTTTLSLAPTDRTLVITVDALSGAGGALSAHTGVDVDTIRTGVWSSRGRMAVDARRLLGDALPEAASAHQEQVVAAVDAAGQHLEGLPHDEPIATAAGLLELRRAHRSMSLPDEQEIARRCRGNGLVALLLLLDADDALRRRFARTPAAVLTDFGLGRPADLLGVQGLACPAMPELPGGVADEDVASSYWRGWLRGGVRQVDPYRAALPPDRRLPRRSDLSPTQWQVLVERVQSVIAGTLDAIER